MEIEIIGSDGAFDFDGVSSCFLIKLKYRHMLIDCGYNVMQELSRLGKIRNIDYIDSIDSVFITHLHMDHVADLERLIYYRFFKYNKKTTIIIPSIIEKDFISMFPKKKFSEIYKNEFIDIDCMYNLKSISTSIDDSYFVSEDEYITYKVQNILMNHSRNTPSCGWLFTLDNVALTFISGDSKASYNLVELVKKLDTKNMIHNKFIIFHDYNEKLSPFESIHACKEDFEIIYKNLIEDDRIEFIKYHNGENRGLVVKF